MPNPTKRDRGLDVCVVISLIPSAKDTEGVSFSLNEGQRWGEIQDKGGEIMLAVGPQTWVNKTANRKQTLRTLRSTYIILYTTVLQHDDQ